MMLSSGRMVDVTNLSVDDIDIDDIITSICSMPRYAGHTGVLVHEMKDGEGCVVYKKKILTVGAHSAILCRILKQIGAPNSALLRAITHDFSEAYVVDVPRELKNCDKMAGYREIEHNVEKTILLYAMCMGPGKGRPQSYCDHILKSSGWKLSDVFDKEICLSLEMPYLMNRRATFLEGERSLETGMEQLLGVIHAMCYRCCIDFQDIAIDMDRLSDKKFLRDIINMLLYDSCGSSEIAVRSLFWSSLTDYQKECDEIWDT